MAARLATEGDFDRVASTIAAAFYDDPLWSWIFPDPDLRPEQQATMFGFYIESSLPAGSVLIADELASAAIVYTPPGEPELTDEAEARIEPFLRSALGSHADAVLETMSRFEQAVPEGPPFYYVSFLGTHPDARGRGLGFGLLAEVYGRADAEGKPVYLESTNPDNNPRYERHGFERRDEFWTPDDARVVTTMWREPR
ncbi:MAG TPA: GNAT family N-acetyltransferase [Solirubrobacterales bacterium]|jgi:GNAT superfamily N-acetyltransferase